jgi:hypothetical protein
MTLIFPKPLRITSNILLTLAIFSIVGGEWTLFQAIAYGKMIYSYSSEGSLQSALEKTFSGKYPCHLCKKISLERKKTANYDSFLQKNTKKWDLILTLLSILEDPHFTLVCYPAFHHSDYAEPIIEVPKPPPNLRIVSFVF